MNTVNTPASQSRPMMSPGEIRVRQAITRLREIGRAELERREREARAEGGRRRPSQGHDSGPLAP